ncbi:MAG: Rrf2 family transcriptional regulator [Burkholderiaceae bacterium]
MRLAEYTDYSLRVLMYCAANPERLVTITELAGQLRLSRNHLMKIVNDLGRQRVLKNPARARRPARRKQPAEIRIGDVVRHAETDFRLVECFDHRTNGCNLTPTCRLKELLGNAMQAWFEVLDDATLADIAGARPGPDRAKDLRSRAAPVAVISGPVTRKRAPR